MAERIALLNQLTRGRVGVTFARGYQKRWIQILSQGREATSLVDGESDQRNREIYDEHVEVIRKAWTEDSWDHDGVHYQVPYPYKEGPGGGLRHGRAHRRLRVAPLLQQVRLRRDVPHRGGRARPAGGLHRRGRPARRLIETRQLLCGTADDVRLQMEELHRCHPGDGEEEGELEWLVWQFFQQGTTPLDVQRRQLELFAEKVLPTVR